MSLFEVLGRSGGLYQTASFPCSDDKRLITNSGTSANELIHDDKMKSGADNGKEVKQLVIAKDLWRKIRFFEGVKDGADGVDDSASGQEDQVFKAKGCFEFAEIRQRQP